MVGFMYCLVYYEGNENWLWLKIQFWHSHLIAFKKKISVYKILYSVETCTTLKKLNEGNAYYEEYSF